MNLLEGVVINWSLLEKLRMLGAFVASCEVIGDASTELSWQ